MLADRLTRHRQARTQLLQVLSVARVEAVEQETSARVGQRLEHLVHLCHLHNMQLIGCMSDHTQPCGCMSTVQAGPLSSSNRASAWARPVSSNASKWVTRADGARFVWTTHLLSDALAPPAATPI